VSAEADVRDVITRWVDGIKACDVEAVVAAHSDDFVQFDVPPPYDGVRGVPAYRDTWPPFFEFLRAGAIFELVELNIVAGDDVAFAYGLLKCGRAEDLANNPDIRLRMTVGLRKVDGEWLIVHEHHSFPLTG
jgi:ketosteroid isomerase-like protein